MYICLRVVWSKQHGSCYFFSSQEEPDDLDIDKLDEDLLQVCTTNHFTVVLFA